jgi:hypothetical protein
MKTEIREPTSTVVMYYGLSQQVAQDARLRGQGGGDGDPGVLIILGGGKVGEEELGDLDVVGGQS